MYVYVCALSRKRTHVCLLSPTYVCIITQTHPVCPEAAGRRMRYRPATASKYYRRPSLYVYIYMYVCVLSRTHILFIRKRRGVVRY